ncbi:MAG: hypothetical protein LBQ64_02205 [Bacteroidales bacterium]|jgi:hypothetical protein|nr:hypothetical protein [Bacteroidales bacterium]
MRKLFFIFVLGMCLSIQGFAQISEGSVNAKIIRTGNRPEAGTFGVYVGPALSDILRMADRNTSWRGFPLVNLKYYTSPNLEFRLGLQFYSESSKTKGVLVNTANSDGTSYGTKSKESYNRIMPGIAYHFSSKNLVDVYLGVAIPLGYDIDDRNSVSSDEIALVNKVKRTSFVIGGEAFIGLQCFVADLPLSLGLEYGISGLCEFGQKYKHEVANVGGTETQIFYTTDGNAMGTNYSDLKSQKGEAGSDIRLTISYYFNNKK